MTPRKKILTAIAAAQVVLALAAVLTPWLVFPVCEPPMHCHYSYMAIGGAAAVIIAAAVISIVSTGVGASRLMSPITAIAGLQFIIFPSFAIGVCGSPQMPCHYGDLPVWNLSGGAVMLLSVIMFFSAREDEGL